MREREREGGGGRAGRIEQREIQIEDRVANPEIRDRKWRAEALRMERIYTL